MYALLRNTQTPSEHDVEEAFDGNLCRCTGYRPILDAVQSFSSKAVGCGMAKANGGGGCCMEKNGTNGANGGGCCKSNGTDDLSPEIKKFKAPEFIEYNPETQLIFPPALRKHEFKALAFGNKKKKWYRPATLEQLLEIKSVYPSAKIIGGSTETQIEVKFKAMSYSVSVFVGDIVELRQYQIHDDYVEIGGNVVLTDVEQIAREAIEKYGPIRGQPFAAMLKQLRYFAGRQIRNNATSAGNIATASPISDLNPVFVASNAILVAKSKDKTTEIPMSEFFKGYRVTALPPDAIIASIRVPAAQAEGEYIRAYKQAKRKDDDIAIVNASLRITLGEDNVVESADLVYGGMAPITIKAKKASEFLVGKTFTDLKTLEGVFGALEEDFDLRYGVPGGMATYRKSLALSFFYKFYHEVLSELDAEGVEVDQQAIGEIEREISFGQKDHQSAAAYEQKTLGKEKPHVAALKQTVGSAQYLDDVPYHKNELYGVLVLSSKPHARILSVNTSAALDMPGVVEWVDRHDLPNPQANWWGAPNCDEVFFAEEEVFTAGQPIGMILADTRGHAEAARNAVKVEYEDLPAIFTIEEAIEKNSFFEHFRYIKKGEVDAAFAEADHVFEGVSRMGGQEHFYLETNATAAIPKPEDGEMEIISSTQNPSET
jgi:xanthine dehydrogenase/oxidase